MDPFALSSRVLLWNWRLQMIGWHVKSDLLFTLCLSLNLSSILPCFFPILYPPSPMKKISPLFSIWWTQSVEESGWQWFKERRRTVKYFNQEPFAEENKRPAGPHRQALGNPIDTCPWGRPGGRATMSLTRLEPPSALLQEPESPIFLGGGPRVAVLPLVSQQSRVQCVRAVLFSGKGGSCCPEPD